MMDARYSGRSGRGRGNARGRGRGSHWKGGGGGNSWVRPRDGNNDNDNNQNSSPTEGLSLESKRGPILSGPRAGPGPRVVSGRGRFSGRGRGRTNASARHSSQSKNTWRRDADADKTTIPEEQGNSKSSSTDNSSADRLDSENGVEKEKSTAENTPTELRKVGNFKLVLPRETKPPSANSQKEIQVKNKEKDVNVEIFPEERKMLSRGNNKVVCEKASTNKPAAEAETANEAGSVDPTQLMIAKGSNKLVLAKSSDRDPVSEFKKAPTKYPQGSSRGKQNLGKKRHNQMPSRGPTVKRVKINGMENTDQEKDVITQGETKGKERETDILTDFAYRETAPNRPRGGRFRGALGKNMGLVRVNPDESKAPICPIFLRGERCENERCTKRHDVPRESAMPVCSFFQRHGQCLKGEDCPFRHVKVNPLAMLCPSFNIQGYCDDEKCIMKHVAPTSRSTHNHKK